MENLEKAVKWWSNKVCKQTHHDNGDYSVQSALAMAIADMGVKQVSAEQRTVFEEELGKLIEEKEKEWEGCYFSIGVDYGPDDVLGAAAKAAGINVLNFPFKTHMYFQDGKIIVRDGYGAPPVEL